MKRTERSYTREFKIKALRLQETSCKIIYKIEQELGIGHGCLTRRRQMLADEGDNAFPGHGRGTPDQKRIRQLERENAILRQERDILKKSSGHRLAPRVVRFQFIESQCCEYPATRVCKSLNVSSSGYYAW